MRFSVGLNELSDLDAVIAILPALESDPDGLVRLAAARVRAGLPRS